jgi:HK97 family phage major capsid protein
MSFDKARHEELKEALKAKTEANREIADAINMEEGTLVIEEEHREQFQKNMRDIKEIKGLLEDLDEMRKIEEWGEQPVEESVAVEAAATKAEQVELIVPEEKTLGQLFTESAEFKELLASGGANMNRPWQYKGEDMAGYGTKDVYSSLPTGTPAAFGTVQRDPIVERRHSNYNRVRSLFPARSTSAATIEYFRVTGFTNSAAAVPERSGDDFASKPQSTLTFVGEQAPVRTLAHWEAAHRNVLADEPQLRSIIDNELMYGLRLEEDDQLLNGDGTGENLTGILQVSGIQTYSWSTGATTPVADTKGDAIRRAATLAFLAYYEPTGVVLHPNDFEDIELTKSSTEGAYLFAVSMQQGGEKRIWRMPVVETPAITEGTALLGAFGLGAQIYDREGANIRVAEQHSDFFVRNAIVVLAEQRLALATKRPEAFVAITFDAAPS